ncbi:MAG: HAMP domain-containing methyl-accepting chemotaxis protein [Arcobacteraceae bacterium]
MIPQFITKKVSNKIIVSMLILMTLSSLAVLVSTITKVNNNNIEMTKKNLDMLNTAVFQSLRNAMNTGDPVQIAKAEEEAQTIHGINHLIIAKSKPLIELYDPTAEFTRDDAILHSFETKNNQMIEVDNDTEHTLRMIKPMIATQECLMCHANQAEGDVIGIMDLTFSLEDSDNDIRSISIAILTWSTILGWITIGIIFFIVKRTIRPLDDLKEGFENLITSNNTQTTLKVSSADEIGDVAILFNQYMKQVNDGLARDAIVIAETNDILQKIANGFFGYEVRSEASNLHVEEMRRNLNFMIKRVKIILDEINITLKNYSQSKYDYKINDEGIYGDLGTVTAGIKLVGNNTSEILAMVLNSGEELKYNTSVLSQSSSNLSNSVTAQSESGKDTTDSLDEITKTIRENTENTQEMANLAKNVTISVEEGSVLAAATSKAMDEIEQQVLSINDAISVIDQISFQTNILSLNAAVEAATAGEAGKGFAVVAQEVRNLASKSAEAAKDIQDIVTRASDKATQGKKISDDMINGYSNLDKDIQNTLSLIQNVSNSSKEQEESILKINTAVISMDRSTKDNGEVSKNISSMAHNIETMSNRLVTTAAKASFLEDSRKQVCDIELIYEIANIKVALFEYKSTIYAQLANKSNTNISKFHILDEWISKYSVSDHNIDKAMMNELQNLNEKLFESLQLLSKASINLESNEILISYAKNVEEESTKIFTTLNQVKEYNCNE